MSKVLRATCEDGVVTALETEVESARILSKGIGRSAGILVMDEERADYLTSSASDLEESLAQAIAALEAASSGLDAAKTAIDTVGTAAGVPSLVLIPLLAPIGSAASSISAAADALAEIKERLK
jgi:hypothetical protein